MDSDNTDKEQQTGNNGAAETEKAKETKSREFSVSSASNAPHSASDNGWKFGDRIRSSVASLIIAVVVGLAAGFAGGWLGAGQRDEQAAIVGTAGPTASQKKVVTNESQLFNSIAKAVGQSVVSVNVTSRQASPLDFFGLSQGGLTQESAGTGVIISSDGLVLTNRHVVPAGSSGVTITLSDGTKLDNVTVVGRTNNSDSLDIAFLKINDTKGKHLMPATLGDSSKVQIGDSVLAIGNALGQFRNTVTSGIISGFGRSVQASDGGLSGNVENLDNLFQTDAAINEGNSGGPLVNMNGEVIGINTAIAGNAQNIGFAIPMNDITGLIKQVMQTGKLQRPYLGVRYIPLTDDYAYQFNLNVARGAYIAPSADGSPSVIPDSPADKAGLKEKDIITQVNGTKIDESHSLTSLLNQHQAGDRVNLTVVRDSKTIQVSVTLGSTPQQ